MPRFTRPRIWLYPYGPSNSALALVDAVDGRLIRREGSKYVHQNGDVVVNWGSGSLGPNLAGVRVLNPPEAVRIAISKRRTFTRLSQTGVQIPAFTSDRAVAHEWQRNGAKVLGRDIDQGHSGRGITVYQPDQQLGEHPLYVKYFTKNREFRIHVFRDNTIFRQEKVRKAKEHRDENFDRYVRSHTRGWAFAFHHFGERPIPAGVDELAQTAVRALGLDFGGVDIGWNQRGGAAVFEVNTAPGIENTSLQAYAEALRNFSA